MNLKIDYCSHKASKYAVENWHYSKRMPKSKIVKYGVWENNNFIGTILYGVGATRKLVNPYNLIPEEGCELLRVALKKHFYPVSKMISITIKMLKKQSPNLKLIVSFADSNENHVGGIYQAGNWVYNGKSDGSYWFKDKKGKIWHPRNVGKDLSKPSICIRPQDCEKVWKNGKYRYLYPLNKNIRKQILKLSKPYPKNNCDASVIRSTPVNHIGSGGAVPTASLNNYV